MSAAVADRRALRALFAAGGVSAFGTQMTLLALPWLVLETSGSATRTGLVFAVQVLPMALLGFLGGEVVQRFGAHRVMVLADAARAPLVALVPLLHGLDALSFPALLAIVAAIGVLGVPYHASQRVLARELVGADPRALTRANGTIEGLFNAAAFAGPALSGALITVLGAHRVLWLDAGTYVVSCLLLLLFVPRVTGAAAPGTPAGPRGALAGVRWLRGDAFLGRAMVSAVLYGFLLRLLAVALPLLAFERFDGDAALGGLLVAGSGAGALAGSLLTWLVAHRVPPSRLMAASAVLMTLPLWLLVLPMPPAALVAAVAVTSAAVPLSNAPFFGVLTARVPEAFLPKVLQSVIAIGNVAGPLGFLAAGVLMDGVGVTETLFLVAAVATLATANLLAALRGLGAPAAPAPAMAGAPAD